MAEGATDWIIRGRTRRSGHNPKAKINRGNVACHTGGVLPGRTKQGESSPPGVEHPGERGSQR